MVVYLVGMVVSLQWSQTGGQWLQTFYNYQLHNQVNEYLSCTDKVFFSLSTFPWCEKKLVLPDQKTRRDKCDGAFSQIFPPPRLPLLVEAEGIDYTELEHFVRPECIFHNALLGTKGHCQSFLTPSKTFDFPLGWAGRRWFKINWQCVSNVFTFCSFKDAINYKRWKNLLRDEMRCIGCLPPCRLSFALRECRQACQLTTD